MSTDDKDPYTPPSRRQIAILDTWQANVVMVSLNLMTVILSAVQVRPAGNPLLLALALGAAFMAGIYVRVTWDRLFRP